ncbi:MGH1-like glycoside hydrolase domain-containing protein [Aquimarina agarivorans]|uniref:MGH1-like glycoside hydrolase domain-containing protein n=1 Tax=Aquimarina agarivorans TaxID=980584 RepID=UPI000248E8B4|nr:glucosidase [Aquimarina agarivorans]
MKNKNCIEQSRLDANYSKKKKWLEWGPYPSERQWGTVREDYSPNGTAWDYFPHDHARSRVYRWGEDGIAGFSDRHCAINFSVALWNGNDPILKERLFGLTGPEGNHAEDVKELYYYLDASPTHSYMKHLYKYPQAAFPYKDLVETNAYRNKNDLEYELLDTGVFNDNKYFDVFTEYAKADDEDILTRITIYNRGADAADISIMPTTVMRNLWSFGKMRGEHSIKKYKDTKSQSAVIVKHPKLGEYHLHFDTPDKWLFTENETNNERLFGTKNKSPYVKDLFHDAVINNNFELTDAVAKGTKFAPLYQRSVPAGEAITIKLRFSKKKQNTNSLSKEFDFIFADRINETDAFYAQFKKGDAEDITNIQRQAFAGMLWTKQYYNIDVYTWLRGDENQPPPPAERLNGRNNNWQTLNNEDIISMPDKWEYPWYAVWDLAFHCVPLAMLDAEFAKNQLILVLREWYMAPNGQIPAYEWAFSDVNPPVHAWAAFQVYEIDKKKTGKGDIDFLKKIFSKLSLNFTWWVNRKDFNQNNVFEGGFLGLDNIGIFDRSNEIPGGGHLEQADGTAWMAMFSLNMLQISVEIALHDPSFEDMCTKFFEHFVHIAASLNTIGENFKGSWDEEQGFFYDVLIMPNNDFIPIKIRSLVGLMTLNAVLVLEKEKLNKLKDFVRRLEWFRNYKIKTNQYLVIEEYNNGEDLLLSMVPSKRMKRLLEALINEDEFMSAYGIRALSKIHSNPYKLSINGAEFVVKYDPAESSTYLFGGNSNWRGPIWMPMNFLFVQSLLEYYKYYGDNFLINCPNGTDKRYTLKELSTKINNNLLHIFKKDAEGNRPVHQLHSEIYKDAHFKDLILFYEYFHGDNGRGVGASHQTGWTGCIATLIDQSCW